MAANILPYLSVLSNIRCNLIPYHGTQNYYFQPYNDGKLKGYTLQYCPTGKVFSQRYCRCLPPWKGHRKTAYSKKQYPNKYNLKSKLPFKPLSVPSTKKYRKVKKNYKLKNRNLFLRNPMMSHDSLRHEMKRRFNLLPHKLSAPSHKNHLMGQFQKSSSVHPIRNTIDKGPKHLIKKQSPKLKQKFRFFKKNKHARNHKQKRKPTVHPFLPVTSIDFSVNLDKQRLDFAQNTIENRLTSIGRRGSLPNFNSFLHSTVPFEPGFDTNFNRQQMDSISRNTLLNTLFEPTQNLDINDPITEIFIPIEDTHHHITETPTGAPTGNSQHTHRHRARIQTGHSQHTRHNIAGMPTVISTGHSQNTRRHRARIPTGRSQHTRHNIAGMPTVISTGHSQHTHLNIAGIPRVTPTEHSQHTHNHIAGISTGHSQHTQNDITGITTGHSQHTRHNIAGMPTVISTGHSQHTQNHITGITTGHSQHTRNLITGIPTVIPIGHSQNTRRHRARIPTGRSQHTRHNIAGMPTVISTGHSQHTHLNIAGIPRVTPTEHSQHTHNHIAGISTGHSQHTQNDITGITTGHSQNDITGITTGHSQNHITGITTGHSQHTQNHITGIPTVIPIGHSQNTRRHRARIPTGRSQHTRHNIAGMPTVISTGHSQHTQNHIAGITTGHSQHTHNNIAGIHTAVPAGHSQTDRITSSHSGVSSASGDVIFNNGIVFSDASHINVDTVQDISVGGHISNVPEVNNDAIVSHNANDHIDSLTDIFFIPDIHTTTIVDHTEIIDKKTNSKKTNSKTDNIFPTLHNDALFVSDIFHSGVTENVGGSGKPSNHVGDFPNGKEIAFQIAQFQDMNTKNNDFQHILKTTSSNHHTGLNGVIHNAGTVLDISDVHGKSHIKAIPKSHILFSGFNINENKLFNGLQGLEPPHHLGEPSLNPFEVTNVGIINNGDILKQGITRNIDMGNIDLQSILSNEVIPVSIGRAKSSSGFNTGGTLTNGGHIITELAEFVNGGSNGNGGDNTMVDGIKEKTIILSDAKKIPDALVFHNALPEFTPLKATISISLQKLHLDINNTKTATATATASQTMIFTELLPSDICLGCKMDGGVGYTNHPTSCDRFVVCYPTDGGNVKPVTQLCPYGLFWSQTALTCRLTKDVYCPHEVCKFQLDKYQYASKRTCRSYWECQGGISVSQCCPWGYSYLDGRGCIEDSTCEIPDVACGIESNNKIIEWGGVCDKRPVVGKNSMYERKDHNKWIEEKCPFGWIYKIELCECTKISELVPPEYIFEGHTCVPEIYLPFTNDFSDHSGNNVYIRVENASLTSGAACFDGHSALAIPAFANMDYGKTLYIHVRYKQKNPVTNLQTLVFNGDCDKMPTMMLGTKPSGNSLTLLTNLNEEKNMWVQSKRPLTDWRDVWLKLENGKIILQSTDHKISATLNGTIARSECGMKIGWGKGVDNFVGCIDEVSIHRCHPETTV